jgi:hypothetical protein
MTENEKQAIRASFTGKRVSQMTKLERQVFDEDFQYGFGTNIAVQSPPPDPSKREEKPARVSSLLRRLGLIQK